MILRQECALGGDPDQIVIARRNVTAFLEALIDLTPHGRGWFDCGEVPPEWSAEHSGTLTKDVKSTSFVPTSARRSPAAERQAKYRERKRGDATGEHADRQEKAAATG